jgi:hypothetical protein
MHVRLLGALIILNDVDVEYIISYLHSVSTISVLKFVFHIISFHS